jgi:ceramide glucosyltransferase
MKIASVLLLFLMSLSVIYTLYATYCTWIFFKKNREERGQSRRALPPVSIIKPLSGLEDDLLEKVLSFCDQDYPSYEVIFSLSERDEFAISRLDNLKRRFPHREIRWVIAHNNRGPNYKVGNLIDAVREAKYDVLAISDGDMRVGPDYLKQTVPLLIREKIGLVTCLYRGCHLRTIFSRLQSLSIQTDFIPNVLLDHRLEGISYGFGATILTSKCVLESVGGLEPLQEYLADDYQMGNRVSRQGYEIRLSPHLVDHMFCTKNLREQFLHHLRWAITQRICRPLGYFTSIITHGVFLALLFLFLERFSPFAVGLFLFVCSVRIASFIFLNRTVIHNDEAVPYFWLVPLNSLLNTGIWFLSLFINTVHWKNHRFRILKGGKICEVPVGSGEETQVESGKEDNKRACLEN